MLQIREKQSGRSTPLITILALAILMTGILVIPENADAEITPEYQLELSEEIVHINPETGVGTFTLTMYSHCIHTITLEVTASVPGLQISPAQSTVTLGSHQSTTINFAIAKTADVPSGYTTGSISVVVTHVDGVPATGKERTASFIVSVHRDQAFSVLTGDLEVIRGAASSRSVKIHNIGNSADFYTLQFLENEGKVAAYPAVNSIRFSREQIDGYPIIITVPAGYGGDEVVLNYRISSITNLDEYYDGALVVHIVDGEGSGQTTSSSSDDDWDLMDFESSETTLVIGILTVIILIGALLFISKKRSKPPKDEPDNDYGSEDQPDNDYRSDDEPDHDFRKEALGILIILMLSSIPMVSDQASAQITGDFTISVNPGAISLNVSPFGSEFSGTACTTLTINSSSLYRRTFQVSVSLPGGLTGYVAEHIVEGDSSKSFPMAIAVEKENEYSQIQGTINCGSRYPSNGFSTLGSGFIDAHWQSGSAGLISPPHLSQMRLLSPMLLSERMFQCHEPESLGVPCFRQGTTHSF